MKKIANLLFLSEMCYFICMAIAHFFSFKVPVLFIYYDVPFHAYQDKIISFAVCAYVALFYEAFRNVSVRWSAIIVMYLTVFGLSMVNLSEELASVMTESQTTMPYWIQTGAIFVLTLILTFFHIQSSKEG